MNNFIKIELSSESLKDVPLAEWLTFYNVYINIDHIVALHANGLSENPTHTWIEMSNKSEGYTYKGTPEELLKEIKKQTTPLYKALNDS